LAGGLGPALKPKSLAGKPEALLLNTILDGRPGTPMPPWRNILTKDEVVWLVDTLKKGAVNEISP
jgi:cytochrome c55X